MSLVTTENVSSRAGWHVTPMGRIVRPIRIRPEKPLPPLSAITSNATGKNDGKKKRKKEKSKLVRARRRTIDPTKWDSQHLKGAFLDSIVVADGGDNFPVTTPSKPETAGEQKEPGLSSDEEGEGDDSDSSESGSIAGMSPTIQKATDRPPPIAHTKCDTVDADHDFDQEKLRTLSLLDSMFGGIEGDQEWGGEEALDSDVDMPELPPVQTPQSPKSSPSNEVLEVPDLRPVIEDAQEDSESEGPSSGASTLAPEHDTAPVTTQNADTDTQAKLKDLFAPQEEQGVSSLTDYHS